MVDGSLSNDHSEVSSSEALLKLKQLVSKNIDVQKETRTGRLWIQYMDMVALVRNCIKAERTGDWNLHLQTALNMLPYYAAAGHHNYLKSTHLYLQKMTCLKKPIL